MRQSVNATFLYCLRATPPRAKLSPVTPAPTAPPKSVGASRPVASVWAAAPSLSKDWAAAAVAPAPTPWSWTLPPANSPASVPPRHPGTRDWIRTLHQPAPPRATPCPPPLAESAPAQSAAWSETAPVWEHRLPRAALGRWPIPPADTAARLLAESRLWEPPTDSPPPGSSPSCPVGHNTAVPLPPNECLS